MPHTGKPSAGCRTCKQRRIKCDESRPGCDRCAKANRPCPGYAEGLDLVLRDQNDVARANSDRRQKAAQKIRTQISINVPCTSSSCNSDSSSSSSESTTLLNPSYLPPSEDDYQLSAFVEAWVLFPHERQANRSFLELIPSMYASAKANSPFSLCVAAISSATYTKFILKARDVDTAEVRQKHAKALTATRMALQDPVESLNDATLMAVCLLGYFEEVVESFKAKISSPRHFDGAAALIKQRQGRLDTENAKRLLLGVRNSIIYRAVSNATHVDENSDIWKDSEQFLQDPAALLDQMSISVANVLAKAATTTTKTVEVLAEATAVDKTLSTWPNAIPASWHPVQLSVQSISIPIIKTGSVYKDYCDLYQDITICSTWNSYRVARIKILALIIRLVPPSSPDQIEAIMKLQQLADDVCASIPFCLGNKMGPVPLYASDAEYPTIDGQPAPKHHHRTAAALGGWWLFRPMKQVFQVGMWLRLGQKEWIGKQLQRLASVYDVEPEHD